ncbi:MAG: MBL fold metallo-hydrolase [Chloroflexi bacterium]|nr:MBL fold metallo-hydrolase [Chloroflexota bacterium]
MPDYQVSRGNAEVISLPDGKGRAAATDVFPNVPASEWDRYPGARGADGKLDVNFGSFVVRSQGVTILVDTGWGPGYPGVLLDELREKGIGIDEIGIVAITHIHPDHVGWNVIEENGKARLTFPKARYLIPKGDYDHFRQRHELEKAPHMTSQVLALEPLGAMEITDGETSLTSEVTLVPTPGHTPGHVSVDIYSQGQRAFILGDVINFPAQAHETHWELIYDNDHKLAQSTREAVLERLEKNGSIVGMGHFRPPSFGRLIRSEGRRLWQVL